ncbi:MAG: FAD-dependent oxidoreductase [Pseudomonadota bacterium]
MDAFQVAIVGPSHLHGHSIHMTDSRKTYDVAVIGIGMMGSAAARHLATMGVRVALVGPPEPETKASHNGAFASHYDEARITRKLDSKSDWSRLSEASIARYAEIAKAGGQPFYHPVGSIMAGPEKGPRSAFIQNAMQVGTERKVAVEELRGDRLRAAFPFFDFPDGILALYERGDGGWINPRCLVTAQISAARSLGASIYRQEARRIVEEPDHVRITLADGTAVLAQKAIVACGAFSKTEGLLPEPLPLTVYARTITFFELPDKEVERLWDMPSVVYRPPDMPGDPYILPPVPYPDGKSYIKLGGDPEDFELQTVDEMKDWFQGNGNEKAGYFLHDLLLNLMPDLTYTSVSYGSCATSFTPSGKPLIYPQSERLIALTGGNGAGAKCGDELGRLGAIVATGGDITNEGYDSDFRP